MFLNRNVTFFILYNRRVFGTLFIFLIWIRVGFRLFTNLIGCKREIRLSLKVIFIKNLLDLILWL